MLILDFLPTDWDIDWDSYHAGTAHAGDHTWTLLEEIEAQVLARVRLDCNDWSDSCRCTLIVLTGGLHDELVKALQQPVHDSSAASDHLWVRLQHEHEAIFRKLWHSAGLLVPGNLHRYFYLVHAFLGSGLDRLLSSVHVEGIVCLWKLD